MSNIIEQPWPKHKPLVQASEAGAAIRVMIEEDLAHRGTQIAQHVARILPDKLKELPPSSDTGVRLAETILEGVGRLVLNVHMAGGNVLCVLVFGKP